LTDESDEDLTGQSDEDLTDGSDNIFIENTANENIEESDGHFHDGLSDTLIEKYDYISNENLKENNIIITGKSVNKIDKESTEKTNNEKDSTNIEGFYNEFDFGQNKVGTSQSQKDIQKGTENERIFCVVLQALNNDIARV
jgi:hypothetical protein